MKRKERAHLKEDPFQNFINNILEKMSQFKKEILTVGVIILSVILVIAAVSLVRTHSHSRENRRYAQALSIKNSQSLSTQEKIDRLMQLKSGRGLSSAAQLFLASLYFEQNRLEEAGELMDNFSSSHIKLINDQKTFLEAQLLNAGNQEREALDLLNQLMADSKTEIAKDLVLLTMARIQIKARQVETARKTLKRLRAEFPFSAFTTESKQLDLEIAME